MKFKRMSEMFAGQERWGAAKGAFTFIITNDGEGYTASAKVIGATPFNGTRNDLGGYCAHATLTAAQEACENFYKRRNA